MLKYRKEVDGLRALAILPVILFHAGVAGLDGGYIGVDVFFVISGYLITSLILAERARGSFSLVTFYERRARRILPALSFMLLITTVAAYLLMSPLQLKAYSASLVSVVTFLSNFYFYQTSGYFAAASHEKPLLHTWSLAVEEQYYLFFPLLVMLLWRLGRRWLLIAILLAFAASLALSQLLSTSYVNANFYLIPTRAWEIFAGSLIALVPARFLAVKRPYAELLSGAGLAMILLAIVWFNENTPFPSLYALAPVAGAALILAFGRSETLVGRLLSNRVLVFIGLLSYSLYLWHQPLFTFVRLKTLGEPPLALLLLMIGCTFVLAYFSYRYVEQPWRNRTLFSRAVVFRYSLASIAIFFAIGVTGFLLGGFEGRWQTPTYTDTIQASPQRQQCSTEGVRYLPPDRSCTYFGDQVTWAAFGDSHVAEIAYELARQLEPEDVGLLHLSFSGCPPALLFEAKTPGCSQWLRESLEYLEQDTSIQNVLVGFRHSVYLHGDQLAAYPALPHDDPADMFATEFRSQVEGDAKELYWKSFREILRRLTQAGKTVYVLYPIPELPASMTKAATPLWVLNQEPLLDLDRASSAAYYVARNQFILAKLDTLPYNDQLIAVRPLNIMQQGDFAPAVLNDQALYFDDDHLSLAGAKLVALDIVQQHRQQVVDSSRARAED